jgi:AraC-like DNA-binding protein
LSFKKTDQRKQDAMSLTQHDIECLYAAREMIAADISRHYTIEQIAMHVGLSATKLKKGFKELFKTTLFEYLETQRMERAKELMRSTDKSLKQISSLAGFRYMNNFSTAFKRKFGVSPHEWRKGLYSILMIMGHLSVGAFDPVISLLA